ncbi:MAG: hypothetical protein LAO78_02125 [Acidobacteriia bacterium]|nr:hypothetical protein [Terriglobia bacterium]
MRSGGIKRSKEKNEAIQYLAEIHGENQDQSFSRRKDPVIAIKSAQGQKEIGKATPGLVDGCAKRTES